MSNAPTKRKFKYDAISRLTHQELAERDCTLNDAGTHVGTATGVWSDFFQYDTRSNLICHTDARGVKTNFTYNSDPLNRLQSVSYDKTLAPTAANILPAATVTYEYMTSGDRTRLKKITDGAGTDEFAYDPEGRLMETKRSFTNRTAYPLTVKYQFDTLDRLEKTTYPTRHGMGMETDKLIQVTFDEASRVNELTYDSKDIATSFAFNAASQTTALTVGHNGGNKWNETYTYEAATGLLTNQKVQLVGGATPALDLSYEYLKYGANVGRTGQLTKIINNKDQSKNKYYDYDALGRLKTVYSFTGSANPMTTNQWTQAYGYDRFGNRTTVTKTGSIGYTDGLGSLSFTDGAGKVRTNRITTAGYTYDEAGNQTCGQTEGGVWQKHKYDAAGRLAQTLTNDTTPVLLVDYSYGASNHRLKQIEYGSGGTTCYYAWDGNSIIAEFSDTGSALSWAKHYVHLGGRLLATHTPGGMNYHHPDRLGTRLVTPETGGAPPTEQTTLPYGTALDIESTGTPTNRRFTSYDRSQKTKLDYAVNRFYNACQGRFTQVDPIGMQATNLGNPQSLNLYAYVGGDPINRIDPDGLFWGFLVAIVAAIAGLFGVKLRGGSISFRTPGFNPNAGVISGPVSRASRPNIFRTPGINGSAGVSGVRSFLAGQNSQVRENLANIGGFFSREFYEILLRVLERVRVSLRNPACARLLGGAANAARLLERSRPLYANNIDPNYRGTGGRWYNPRTGATTAAEALSEASNPTSRVAARAETGGRNIYLNHRFFTGISISGAATIYIHELRHNSGLGGEIDANYNEESRRISIRCGTSNPFGD